MMPALEQFAAGDFDALLCDADGCLFPSEEPAFEASATITNRLLDSIGCAQQFEADELRVATTGLNFRTTAARLAAEAGKPLDDESLTRWVGEEKRAVTRHLAEALRPDASVIAVLTRLGRVLTLAGVSSSALSRLDACFRATGLDELFPRARRFSAEDSLPRPTSKPDPAIYLYALDAIGIHPSRALAIEDSVPGARSAIAAGVPTIGNLTFVPAGERAARCEELLAAGAAALVRSWDELDELLRTGSASLTVGA